MCTPNTNRFLVRSWCYFGSKRFHNGLIVISRWSVIKSLGMWFLEICVRITRVSFRKHVYILLYYTCSRNEQKKEKVEPLTTSVWRDEDSVVRNANYNESLADAMKIQEAMKRRWTVECFGSKYGVFCIKHIKWAGLFKIREVRR